MKQSLARLARPFSSRNYRLYFGGQVVSLTGSWMTQTASLWLAYHLTRSPLWLGIVGFAAQVPNLVVGPLAGVWVDRVNRYRLLLLTQLLSMFQSLTLAFLALRGELTIEGLIVLSVVQGLINSFDMPTRQSLVIQFIDDREHLAGAIALNSSMFNMTRVIGPAIAGWVIARSGAGICYLADGISYLAVLAALGAMRIGPAAARPPRRHPWQEFSEGVRYTFGSGPIRILIATIACFSFCLFAMATLSPIFAREVYGGDARTLGLIMSASGLGAMLGGVFLAARPSPKGLGRVIVLGAGLAGSGILLFSFARHLAMGLPLLCMAGIGGILVIASSNTLVQTLVEDSKRGRVMSLFTVAFMGGAPLGSLFFGAVAEHWGAPRAMALSGSIALFLGALFAWNLPRMRAGAAAHRAAAAQ